MAIRLAAIVLVKSLPDWLAEGNKLLTTLRQQMKIVELTRSISVCVLPDIYSIAEYRVKKVEE